MTDGHARLNCHGGRRAAIHAFGCASRRRELPTPGLRRGMLRRHDGAAPSKSRSQCRLVLRREHRRDCIGAGSADMFAQNVVLCRYRDIARDGQQIRQRRSGKSIADRDRCTVAGYGIIRVRVLFAVLAQLPEETRPPRTSAAARRIRRRRPPAWQLPSPAVPPGPARRSS